MATEEDRQSRALISHARTIADLHRNADPALAGETISLVVVVGPDGKALLHPYKGDAIFEMVTTGRAPLHPHTATM